MKSKVDFFALIVVTLFSLTGCTTSSPTLDALATQRSNTPTTPSEAVPPTSTPQSVTHSPESTIQTPHPTPPTAPTVYPPPPAGWQAPFALGGHIRTWDYVTQMKYAGMTWAKLQVHYPADARNMINTAHQNGFKIQLTGLGDKQLLDRPDFTAEYGAWVADLAASGADAIEVWNEPNIDREWPSGQISAEDYTKLLCTAYDAVKAANPGTAVISAAPAPTGYFGGCGPEGCDDIPFLEGMIAAGATDCMDYLGAHYAAGATSPVARGGHPAAPTSTHHSWYFLQQTELYFELFSKERQLFFTEMGYASQEGVALFSDTFAWARNTTNAQQADWLTGAINLARHSQAVYAIMVWNVDFVRYGYDPQDGYAIIRPDGSCPACEKLHNALVRTTPPVDQDRYTLRLPWQAGVEHCRAAATFPAREQGVKPTLMPTQAVNFDLNFEPVLAAHSGWVIKAEDDENWGNIILLCRDQNPSRDECSRYAHLDAYTVSVGQYVERAQEIGLSGDSGNTAVPTLYFELFKDQQPVPAAFEETDKGSSSKSCYVSQNIP
ncbi:MAG: peptidoglycan DD-metalloendopeptidase family protein [Anaerolineae bacterium]|nr:peptidoglycan DD-metalloendopeptidase family protein [Anaerolineae bacterium]